MTMIDGRTKLIAHLGFPTETFKAPMIYNPYFRKHGINAVVVPMGCKAPDYASFLRLLFRLSNIHGALVTMPHKVATVAQLDEASVSVKVAGACNAIRIDPDGRLVGEMFDGDGFVRGVQRKGRTVTGARALVVGCGGVGSAIAAALAKAGAAQLALFDTLSPTMDSLAERLQTHYPKLKVDVGSADPAGFDIVVNATPLGMRADDPLPINVDRIAPSTFVGEVVLKQEITPLLAAVRARGGEFQIGTDMLFEQIPAHLEFFGFGLTTAEELRGLTEINY
jgi:shikimate dehydrogenase